jgi:Fe-S-cluster containining protein
MRNDWWSKIYRNIVACFLPVSKKRVGQCQRCGACCKLPNVCPFLRYNEENQPRCIVYFIRPFACRKYPRTAREHITQDTCCGFSFKETKSDK